MRTQTPASTPVLQHPPRSSSFLPGPRLPIPPRLPAPALPWEERASAGR